GRRVIAVAAPPVRLSLAERARAYRAAFPDHPSAWPHVGEEQGLPVLYATWLIGQDYRNKGTFYGQYPKGYEARVLALFPDVLSPPADPSGQRLHVFSGSLPPGPYARCDLKQPAEYQCSVYDLPRHAGVLRWPLVLADPPYSKSDAVK